VADPRENQAGAYYRTDCGRDKSDARPVDETWGRGEITPFGMELRTHFSLHAERIAPHATLRLIADMGHFDPGQSLLGRSSVAALESAVADDRSFD
jgi:hypothetical protein